MLRAGWAAAARHTEGEAARVRLAQDLLRQRLAQTSPEEIDGLARALLAGEKTVESAALELVRQMLKEPS